MPKQRTCASLLAAVGMVAAGAAVWALDEYGPRSRVVFVPYLPAFGELAHVLVAALLGLSICAGAGRRLGRDAVSYRSFRLEAGCFVGGLVGVVLGAIAAAMARAESTAIPIVLAGTMLGAFAGAFLGFKRAENASRTSRRSIAVMVLVTCALLAWVIARQLDAFPSSGTVAERDAWARAHVREYPGLARFASQLPVVVADVTRVVAIAPTGTERHSYARDMDGDAMRFTLEVVGETARGTLWVDATFTEGNLFVWRVGRWTFDGVTTPVEIRADR